MKSRIKIIFLMILQLCIVLFSFTTLYVMHVAIADSSHLIDILGYNRFLAMSIINEHNEIIKNNLEPSEIIPYKNQLLNNLDIIKNGGVYNGIKISPIDEEYIKYFDEFDAIFNKFVIDMDTFSASKNNEKTTENLEITGEELVQNYDILVGKIAKDVATKNEFVTNLELAFAVSVSVMSVILIVLIINTVSAWSKETEMTLHSLFEKSERLKKLSTALDKSALVTITDRHGIITYVNQKFCEISGYSESELIGKNIRILKSEFHTPEFYKRMWKTILSGKIWNGNIKNKPKNGTYYWADTTIIPFVNNSGKIYEYISIQKDITEFMNLQDKLFQLEKFSAIGELAARLAHDMRNPLNIVGNGIEIIKETTKEAFTIENCKRMEQSLERLSHQIEDVMDFIRPHTLALVKVPIDKIIQNALGSINIPKEIQLKMPQNNIDLFCDIHKMTIVFNNIIYNAVQKLDEGGVIQISTEESDHESIIKIQDSGHSIPEEELTKIFEPLFTTKQRGTGLGLASCQQIIKSHNGEIYASNNPTTFTIKIPKII